MNAANDGEDLPHLADPATFLFHRKSDRTLWPGWDLWRRTVTISCPRPD